MAAPIFQLTMRSGPTPGKVFPLEKQEILLGRDLANEIAISDPEVSRRHARFLMQEDNVIIEDLGSTNGTFLNGQRIASPQQLRAGDVVTLGENIVMVFDRSDFDPMPRWFLPDWTRPFSPYRSRNPQCRSLPMA